MRNLSLCFGACFSIITSNVFAAAHLQGDGTVASPFQITSCSQLQSIGSGTANLSADYVLTQNISCASTEFMPIGTQYKPFTGTFNGQDYTILDLNINRPNRSNTGLFGYTSGATIKNIKLQNVNVIGGDNTGGLVGLAYGTPNATNISDVDVSGVVKAQTSTGEGLLGNAKVGGVVGTLNNNSKLSNAQAKVTVTGIGTAKSQTLVGGIAGVIYKGASVTSSQAQAEIVANDGSTVNGGALIGYISAGVVSNSWATGTVTGSQGSNVSLGGLVGYIYNYEVTTPNISNSYAETEVVGSQGNNIGGLVGYINSDAKVHDSYAKGLIKGQSNTIGGLIGLITNGSKVTNSYAATKIDSTGSSIGGLVGTEMTGSTVTSSYYDKDISGQHDAGKGIPENTSDMMKQSTFANWNFKTSWKMVNGREYPQLQWQTVPFKVNALNITSPEVEDKPFPVTLLANSRSFDGTVYLSSNRGRVSPEYVTLTDGKWTGNVTTYIPGRYTRLELRWGNTTGETKIDSDSNAFDVNSRSGYLSANSGLIGKVVQNNGETPTGLVLGLYRNNPSIASKPLYTPQIAGKHYLFANIKPGNYYLEAQATGYQSVVQQIKTAARRGSIYNIVFVTPTGYTSSGQTASKPKTPILLVPGIMGSTVNHSANQAYNYLFDGDTDYDVIYPELPFRSPKWNSHELKLLDPYNQLGWNNLIKTLQSQYGYQYGKNLFTVPYDWSLPISQIRDQYLKPWIQYAEDQSGRTKVDIIAHSMGGLVVRSYIQSKNYKGTVNKFAMVGTPNKGADSVYYLWEGGNPIYADQAAGNTTFPGSYFYTRTLGGLYQTRNRSNSICNGMTTGATPTSCDYDKAYDFVHKAVMSAGQLMPTYTQALTNDVNQLIMPIKAEPNSLVKALNNPSLCGSNGCLNPWGQPYQFNAPGLVMGSTPSMVQTKLFAGTNVPTRFSNYVLPQSPSYTGKLYKDGYPLSSGPSGASSNLGDGTVLTSSVDINDFMPSNNQLPIDNTVTAKHGFLIKDYMPNIISFITGKSYFVPQQHAKSSPSSYLVIKTKGDVQPAVSYITPQGQLKALTPENQFSLNHSTIIYPDPAVGSYDIKVTSTSNIGYRLSVRYVDPSQDFTVAKSFSDNITSTAPETFTVGLAQSVQNPSEYTLSYSRNIEAPDAPTLFDNNGYIQLNWKDPAGDQYKDVVAYLVYYRPDTSPYYQLFATTTNKSYLTSQSWSQVSHNQYVVQALLKDTSSTVYSPPSFYAES